MATLSPQDLVLLLKLAGIDPDKNDLEHFKPLIEKYMDALKVLHSLDLSDEEIAPTFHPEWRLK